MTSSSPPLFSGLCVFVQQRDDFVRRDAAIRIFVDDDDGCKATSSHTAHEVERETPVRRGLPGLDAQRLHDPFIHGAATADVACSPQAHAHRVSSLWNTAEKVVECHDTVHGRTWHAQPCRYVVEHIVRELDLGTKKAAAAHAVADGWFDAVEGPLCDECRADAINKLFNNRYL